MDLKDLGNDKPMTPAKAIDNLKEAGMIDEVHVINNLLVLVGKLSTDIQRYREELREKVR